MSSRIAAATILLDIMLTYNVTFVLWHALIAIHRLAVNHKPHQLMSCNCICSSGQQILGCIVRLDTPYHLLPTSESQTGTT